MTRLTPIRVTFGNSLVLIALVILNTINLTVMDQSESENATTPEGNSSSMHKTANATDINTNQACPAATRCDSMRYPCIKCARGHDCHYGKPVNYTCKVLPEIQCSGDVRTFNVTAACRFCYQTEIWEHACIQKANCNSVASPRQFYRSNCTVFDDIVCLGRRTFAKRIVCSWTGGARWSTAFALALTLGGFGADRFYLGHWQEGMGKLFSFGGLGVWTLIDALLIGVHHLGPADGSLYI